MPCGLTAVPRARAPSQAHSLVFSDLSAEQMSQLRNPKKGLSARELLAKYMGLTDLTQSTQAILLDLYSYTLQFGQVSLMQHCLLHQCLA